MAGRSGATRTNGTAVSNKICQFKLVLLGESAVGKSSLVLRFVKGQFHEYQESTIGGTAESTRCWNKTCRCQYTAAPNLFNAMFPAGVASWGSRRTSSLRPIRRLSHEAPARQTRRAHGSRRRLRVLATLSDAGRNGHDNKSAVVRRSRSANS